MSVAPDHAADSLIRVLLGCGSVAIALSGSRVEEQAAMMGSSTIEAEGELPARRQPRPNLAIERANGRASRASPTRCARQLHRIRGKYKTEHAAIGFVTPAMNIPAAGPPFRRARAAGMRRARADRISRIELVSHDWPRDLRSRWCQPVSAGRSAAARRGRRAAMDGRLNGHGWRLRHTHHQAQPPAATLG